MKLIVFALYPISFTIKKTQTIPGGYMERLADLDSLSIQQKAFMGEVFTRFEVENEYLVMDSRGENLYYAQELAGDFFMKMWLRSFRPFKMSIVDTSGQTVLTLDRPFRFYYHEINIYDANGSMLGRIKKEFSMFERIYYIYNASGKQILGLYGPIFRPWTFLIKFRGTEVGKIVKKWSGITKETFTTADNFGIQFPRNMNLEHKAILLGAVFLIDFVHFEQKSK